MGTRHNKKLFFWGFLVTLLGSTVIYLAAIAHGPDFDLEMIREIPTQVKIDEIQKAVSDISTWPQWFHSLKEAQMLDGMGRPLSVRDWNLQPGSLLELSIDPKKGPWKRFKILTSVTQYVPKKELSLRVLKDSSGKLNQIFDRLDWKMEFKETPQGSLIRGTVSAHAIHWRSKLFGTIAKKILLTQVFYPDLLKLAGMKNVKSGISLSPTEQ